MELQELASTPEFARDLADAAADLAFNRHLGVSYREVRAGHAEVVLPFGDHLLNHIGTMHAVAEAAPAEMAAAVAATSRLGDLVARGFVPVVRQLVVGYRQPVAGDLVAVADVSEDDAAAVRASADAGGRPRIEVAVRLECDGQEVGEVTAHLVFLDMAGGD